MEDRLGELRQFGQGNPFMDEAAPEDPEPFLDEFFAKVEEIRGEIKQMRGNVIELKQDYAAALDQVRLASQNMLRTRITMNGVIFGDLSRPSDCEIFCHVVLYSCFRIIVTLYGGIICP